MTAPRTRRSLTHVGGPTETWGEAEEARALARALDVPLERSGTGDDEDRAHVHGFHAYPARLHPLTAARLVEAFAPAGGTVLDPFCGSGTVLVEAMLAGRPSVGTDLNPLAIALSTLKTHPLPPAARVELVEAAHEARAFADARREARAGSHRRYPPEDAAQFDPHVLLELDSLRAALEQRPRGDVRRALWLVLSAILVKVSRRQSDTEERLGPRRLAAGFVARLFAAKAEELARRMQDFTERLPPRAPASDARLDDATKLLTVKPASIDAVVTSPPYVATYDYLAHHALRLRWLELDAGAFEAGEVGARRAYAALGPAEARTAWARELGKVLLAMARVLRPGAPAALVMADSAVGRHPLRADEIAFSIAEKHGLVPVARASQARPHFHKPSADAFQKGPRREHALLFRKARASR